MIKVQRNVKEDKAVAEKLNHFFASIFTREGLKEAPRPEALVVSNLLQALPQTEVSLEKVLE